MLIAIVVLTMVLIVDAKLKYASSSYMQGRQQLLRYRAHALLVLLALATIAFYLAVSFKVFVITVGTVGLLVLAAAAYFGIVLYSAGQAVLDIEYDPGR